MTKTNKCYLREDETLAKVVKKYQCLYDKCSLVLHLPLPSLKI